MAESQETKLAGTHEDQTETTTVRIVSAFHVPEMHLIRRQITNVEGNRRESRPESSSSPGLLQKSRVDDTMLDETPGGAAVEPATVKTPEHTSVPSLAGSRESSPSPLVPEYGDSWASDSNTPDDTSSQDSSRSGSVAYPSASGLLDWSVVDAKLKADRKLKNELRKLAGNSKSSWVLKHLLQKAYPETQKKPGSKAKVPQSKKGIIRLKDCIGRKFIFPFDACKTWEVSVQVPPTKYVGLSLTELLGHAKISLSCLQERRLSQPYGWSGLLLFAWS